MLVTLICSSYYVNNLFSLYTANTNIFEAMLCINNYITDILSVLSVYN